MAQQYTPAEADNVLPFLPRPQRSGPATTTTTIPTTTTELETFPQVATPQPKDSPASSPATTQPQDSVYLPAPAKPPLSRRFFEGCITVANRVGALVVRYRVELVPTAVVGTVTGLGWWQNLAGVGGWGVAAYAGLAIAGAGIAACGVKEKNDKLMHAGAGITMTFADVATAVGAGPGGISLTAAAVTTGAAYTVWVPWLIKHRKGHKELPSKSNATANANASVDVQVQMDKGQAAIKAAANSNTANEEDQSTIRVPGGPFHDDVIPYAADDSTNVADPIRLGWDEYGQPIYLTTLYRHTLIAGASDWGKSGVANLIIKKLLKKQHVEIYGIDLKPGAPELGPWAPLLKRLARTPEEARELLKDLLAEGERRGAHLEILSRQSLARGGPAVRKWIPGDPNHPDPQKRGHGTAIFLICDELGELVRQDEELRKEEAEARKLEPDGLPAEPPITKLYESALALLRFLGMQFVSATQQPSSTVFGGRTDARGNYVNRISTLVADPDHAQFVFGKRYQALGLDPAKLRRPGEIFLACPEMPTGVMPARIRVEYVSDKDIAADVAHLHSHTPAQPIGRFAPQGQRADLTKTEQPAKPQLLYPDGKPVDGEWPGLYKVFLQLCSEQGYATKKDLGERGPFSSLDTVRRALEVWVQHGVVAEKVGTVRQFSVPAAQAD
ncbi:FtsK/SpoIIIE domain-containing protein [Kitasatospora sp. NPDC086791]|uniref:FtsK/SpoIIIE domain-containing protein n=1 Tax=Kitasatospora sp. NPDC086791 TaxID=3155178 RepID=UPI0034353291